MPFLGLAESGIHTRMVQAIAYFIQANGRADRNIEALGKAKHRNMYMGICLLKDLFTQPELFRAEPDGGLFLQWEFGQGNRGWIEAGGNNPESGFAQMLETSVSIVCIWSTMTMQVDPVGSTHCHLRIQREGIRILDYVQVLYAEALAGAHDCTGIVRLENVLQDDANMVRAMLNHLFHTRLTIRRYELQQMLNKGILGTWIQLFQ